MIPSLVITILCMAGAVSPEEYAAGAYVGEGCEGCTFSGGAFINWGLDLDGDGEADIGVVGLIIKKDDGTCIQDTDCPHGSDCWSTEKAGALLSPGWSYYLEVLRCDGSFDHEHWGATNNSKEKKFFPGTIDTSHGVECDNCGKYRFRFDPPAGSPISESFYSPTVTTNCSDCVLVP